MRFHPLRHPLNRGLTFGVIASQPSNQFWIFPYSDTLSFGFPHISVLQVDPLCQPHGYHLAVSLRNPNPEASTDFKIVLLVIIKLKFD